MLVIGNAEVGAALERLRVHGRADEVQHPTQILRRDEMQRAAHQPVAHDRAAAEARLVDVRGGQAGRTDADAQLFAEPVLRLDRAGRPHRVGNLDAASAGQTLGIETQPVRVLATEHKIGGHRAQAKAVDLVGSRS